MSSHPPTKRKLACRSCRQRKKRCDARQPTCSLCTKFNIRCEYSSSTPGQPRHHGGGFSVLNSSSGNAVNLLPQASLLGSSDFDTINGTGPPQISYEQNSVLPDSGLRENPNGDFHPQASNLCTPLPAIPFPVTLPDDSVFIPLVDIFLSRCYDRFPCFHKASILKEAHTGLLQAQSTLLSFIMCAIAAKYHPDPAVQGLQQEWYEQARFLYELTERDPHPALRTLQGAVCLVSYSGVFADWSGGWLFNGKAWRQACALGLNRLDSERPAAFTLGPAPQSPLEKEEYRRTLWLLFIFDRANIWATGWVPAMDDRQLKINLPVDEVTFQKMTLEATEKGTGAPFSPDPNVLISTVRPTGTPNMLQCLLIAHLILGLIVQHVFSLHDSPDPQEYSAECDRLEDYIVKFRLSLPQKATSILSAPAEIRQHVVWLNMTLNTMTILLHFKRPTESDTSATCPKPDHFAHVIGAAQNTVQLIKDTTQISIESLILPNVIGTYYLSATVLVIEGRATNYPSFQADMVLFSLLFEQFQEFYPKLAMKFKYALEFDLNRSEDSLKQLREDGYRGLLADCAKWKHIAEKYA